MYVCQGIFAFLIINSKVVRLFGQFSRTTVKSQGLRQNYAEKGELDDVECIRSNDWGSDRILIKPHVLESVIVRLKQSVCFAFLNFLLPSSGVCIAKGRTIFGASCIPLVTVVLGVSVPGVVGLSSLFPS